MNIDHKGPVSATEFKAERLRIINSMVFPALFVGLLVLVHFSLTSVFFIEPSRFGLFPRSFLHLTGVLTFHLVHSGFLHLYYNSLALFVLGSLTFYFYRGIALTSFAWIYLLTGVWLWAFGRDNSCHIGASGLVYGLVCFLFFGGVFRRDRRLLFISVLVLFFYGSLATGIFPIQESISWEGHLMGSLAGLTTAWFYRKEGPKKQEHNWREDEEEHDPRLVNQYAYADPRKGKEDWKIGEARG